MAITVKLEDGRVLEMQGDPKKTIKEGGSLLGKGGQGAVYKVKDKQSGKCYALKTYLKHMSKDFMDNLRKNIINGAPNDSFLWPLGCSETIGSKCDKQGYMMELYPSSYSSFIKIIKGKAQFPNKEMQLTALIDLVDAFEALHAQGGSYQDLNDGGIMFDCNKGKVLICDNDNVAPSGVNIPVDDEGHCIQGKFKYMAPEVAIGMFQPDKHSDRFSLAVLMFMILCQAHPYDGIKRLEGPLTPKRQAAIYGTEATFIFHPTDKSNRPDPQMDKNALAAWPTLPDFIQNLFIKTFTSGMPRVGQKRDQLQVDRQGRASEKEWREALHRWMDSMAECPKCNKSVCPSFENNAIQRMTCPHCKKDILVERPVFIIKRNGKVVRTIVLEDGKQLPKSSITKEKSNDPALVVKRSKKAADVYGLENLLPYQWKCSQAGAKDRLIGTNETVPAFNGVYIEFDYEYSGEIVYSRH